MLYLFIEEKNAIAFAEALANLDRPAYLGRVHNIAAWAYRIADFFQVVSVTPNRWKAAGTHPTELFTWMCLYTVDTTGVL